MPQTTLMVVDERVEGDSRVETVWYVCVASSFLANELLAPVSNRIGVR